MRRPRRPYKNFGLFCWDNGSDANRPYPCLMCRGRGYYQHSTEIVECGACKGTGQGTKEACLEEDREIIQAYEKEKAEYQRLCRTKREALCKLTKEEIKAIKELGL